MNKYLNIAFSLIKDIPKTVEHRKWESMKVRENPEICMGADLKKYRESKQGKRCFIVGNGPSLQIKDLDQLIGEDCFAANGIWGLFDRTQWRPTYYFLGDPQYAQFIGDKIIEPVRCAKESFFVLTHFDKYPALLKSEENINFYCQRIPTIYTAIGTKLNRGRNSRFYISGDVSKNMKSCGTITFEMLQMAIYMGYSEIYLLGIDHDYSKGAHFGGCHQLKGTTAAVFNFMNWEKGYRTAKYLAEQKNIKIFNATRGGCLEIFNRINFDEIT